LIEADLKIGSAGARIEETADSHAISSSVGIKPAIAEQAALHSTPSSAWSERSAVTQGAVYSVSVLADVLGALGSMFDVKFVPGSKWSADRGQRLVTYPEQSMGLQGGDHDLGAMLAVLGRLLYAPDGGLRREGENAARQLARESIDLLRTSSLVSARFAGARPLIGRFVHRALAPEGEARVPRVQQLLDSLFRAWADPARSLDLEIADPEVKASFDALESVVRDVARAPFSVGLRSGGLPPAEREALARASIALVESEILPEIDRLHALDVESGTETQPPPDQAGEPQAETEPANDEDQGRIDDEASSDETDVEDVEGREASWDDTPDAEEGDERSDEQTSTKPKSPRGAAGEEDEEEETGAQNPKGSCGNKEESEDGQQTARPSGKKKNAASSSSSGKPSGSGAPSKSRARGKGGKPGNPRGQSGPNANRPSSEVRNRPSAERSSGTQPGHRSDDGSSRSVGERESAASVRAAIERLLQNALDRLTGAEGMGDADERGGERGDKSGSIVSRDEEWLPADRQKQMRAFMSGHDGKQGEKGRRKEARVFGGIGGTHGMEMPEVDSGNFDIRARMAEFQKMVRSRAASVNQIRLNGKVASNRELEKREIRNLLKPMERALLRMFPPWTRPAELGYFEDGDYDTEAGIQAELRFLATGERDPRVCTIEGPPQRREAAVGLLLDVSGSRGEARRAMKQTVLLFDEPLCSAKVSHAIVTYNGEPQPLRKLKPSAPARERDVMFETIEFGGDNNELAGMDAIEKLLKPAPVGMKKIIFVITDGDGDARVRDRILELDKRGIWVVGIGVGIGCDSVKKNYPRHLLVATLDELPKAFGPFFVAQLARRLNMSPSGRR
jgi:hypothetical protein